MRGHKLVSYQDWKLIIAKEELGSHWQQRSQYTLFSDGDFKGVPKVAGAWGCFVTLMEMRKKYIPRV